MNAPRDDLLQTALARVDFTAARPVQQFVAALAEALKHPIQLHAVPFASDLVTGAWIQGRSGAAHILYEAQSPAIHQAAIILHECAHILAGHSTLTIDDQADDLGAVIELFARDDATLLAEARLRGVPDGVDPVAYLAGLEQETEALGQRLYRLIADRISAQALAQARATEPVWNNLAQALRF